MAVIGRTATDAEVAGWNIDIGRNGENLPPGSGTVSQGKEVFAQQCAACHGDKGEGGVGERLVGGQGTIATPKPIKTVGSFWPYAPTLFDYIRRAMPQNAPQSLANEDVYAVSAYILNLNGLLPADATLDAKTLAKLWEFNTNAGVNAPPMTFAVDGKQYVAILVGMGGAWDKWFIESTKGLEKVPPSSMLFVFSL